MESSKCSRCWSTVLTLLAWAAIACPLFAENMPGSVLADLEAGQFDRIIAWLDAGHSNRVKHLRRDLLRYDDHAKHWAQTRQEAFEFAYGEMIALTESGQTEDAIVFAIEAHGLAKDKKDLLRDQRVVDLIETASGQAAKANQAGDWVDALSLYRRLDLLFDDPASAYHENFKHAIRRLHIMRIYIPDQLKTLYEQRAKRRGEPSDPINLGNATWNKRLEGITQSMLINAMEEAEDRHISNPTYRSLLGGAIDALLIFLDTTGLDEAFPSMADTDRLSLFRQYLDKQRNAIGSLTRFELRDRLHKIFRKNSLTLNLPEKVIVYEMSGGALGILDEFTNVIWPYDLEQFRRNTKGSFYGVGIQISMSPGPLTVTDVPANSTCFAAGIRTGAVITRINGRDVMGYSPGYVMWKIRDERGDGVQIDIERPDKEASTIELERGAAIKIKRPTGRLTVKSPLRGTPAYEAGIRADDVIVSVNGQDTATWTLDQAVRKITGRVGTVVNLGIERKGQEHLEIPIQRARIEIESVKGWKLKSDDTWDYYVDREQKIGYVRLTQFLPQSSDELDDALDEMEMSEGLSALVLDLRFNPGGLLDKAVDVADRFVPEGSIVTTVNADGDETDKRQAKKKYTRRRIPMVVLINRTSASASEIVSGALQDYDVATIIGDRSYGKGSVQDLFPIDLPQRTAHLKLTTQYYQLPKNRIIHRMPHAEQWGVEPDWTVYVTDDQVRTGLELRQELDVLRRKDELEAQARDPAEILDKGADPQLAAALLVLKTQILLDERELAKKPDRVTTQ